MSKFIRLYDSKSTPLTGDMFTIVTKYFSEDPDILDTTGSSYISAEEAQDNIDYFTAEGYTMVDNGQPLGSANRKPKQYPRQFYIQNDQSGSVDSEFTSELEYGDEIILVDRSDAAEIHYFTVIATNCIDCTDDIVKVATKDYVEEGEDGYTKYEDLALAKDMNITASTPPYAITSTTVNNHAIKAVKNSRTDTYITVDTDTIVSYKFKEGVFPLGGYTVLKDIVHTGALNDIIIDASNYTGDEVEVKIEMDSTTAPETFKWRAGEYIGSTTPSNAYGETQRGISLQFVPLNLGSGDIKVKWLATTGHTTDTWTFKVYPNNKRIYKSQINKLDQIFR